MNIKNKINNLPQELRRNIFNYLIWTPKNKEEFKNAVIKWSENKEKAFKKYGHVSLWNTSNIINTDKLFDDQPIFFNY